MTRAGIFWLKKKDPFCCCFFFPTLLLAAVAAVVVLLLAAAGCALCGLLLRTGGVVRVDLLTLLTADC